MSLEYIRNYYKVPAFEGQGIEWNGRPGKIVGASGPHLSVKFEDQKHAVPLHPNEDGLKYYAEGREVRKKGAKA